MKKLFAEVTWQYCTNLTELGVAIELLNQQKSTMNACNVRNEGSVYDKQAKGR